MTTVSDLAPTSVTLAPHAPPRQGLLAPQEEVTWATLGHLTWLAGAIIGLPVLGPLVAWFVLRDRGPFVRHHAAEALNANLSYLIYSLAVGAAAVVIPVLTFGVGLGALAAPIVLSVLGIAFTVVASVQASRGAWYRYPLCIRFVA